MAKFFFAMRDVLTPTLGFRRIRGAHIFLLFLDVIVNHLLMPVSMFTDFLKEPQHSQTLTPCKRPVSIGHPILVNRLPVIDFSSHFYFFYKNFFSDAYNTQSLFSETVPPLQNSGTGSGTAESLTRQGLEPNCTAVPPVPAFWKLFFFQKSILLRKLYI